MEKTFVSLFSGAGGLDQGFIQAGWKPMFMTDFWDPAIGTLKKNHKNTIIEKIDISNINKNYIKNIVKNEIIAVIGGPPCQAFSRLNQNQIFNSGKLTEENLNDPRRSLFMDFLRISSYINPIFIVMENVSDLKTRKLGGQTNKRNNFIVDIIKEEFNKIKYNVIFDVLKVKDYNVPQIRKRMIFIAVRQNININHSLPEKIKLITSVRGEFNKILPIHPNQEIKKHDKFWIEKVKFIPQGGYYNNLPIHLKVLKNITLDYIFNYNGQIKEYCFKNDENKFIFFKEKDGKLFDENNKILKIENVKEFELFKIMPRMGTYLRRISEDISHTITRNPIIHPNENRELTVREKASIQTFPPTYEFVGKIPEQHILVGNSVPCNLGESIAKHLERLLF